MQIIRPEYGTGILIGVPIEQEDITVNMLGYLTELSTDEILDQMARYYSSDGKSDWLNFADELDTSGEYTSNIQLLWPDENNAGPYAYIGILKHFSSDDFDIMDIFSIDDQDEIYSFIEFFKINHKVQTLISIGNCDG